MCGSFHNFCGLFRCVIEKITKSYCRFAKTWEIAVCANGSCPKPQDLTQFGSQNVASFRPCC